MIDRVDLMGICQVSTDVHECEEIVGVLRLRYASRSEATFAQDDKL
jgi:hypothetical protein